MRIHSEAQHQWHTLQRRLSSAKRITERLNGRKNPLQDFGSMKPKKQKKAPIFMFVHKKHVQTLLQESFYADTVCI